MKKLVDWIRQNPYLFGLVVILAALLIVNFFVTIDWYWFLVAIAGYGLIVFFIDIPTSVGNIAYFLSRSSKKQGAFASWHDWAYRHKTKSDYSLVSYGLYNICERNYEYGRDILGYLLSLKKISPTILKYARQDYSIAQWKCGDIDGAIDTMQKMLADYEVFFDTFYVTLGYYYLEKGDIENALLYTNKALEESPDHAPAYDNLGQIAFRQGDYATAETNFRKGLDLRPSMADSKYYMGCLAELAGDMETARFFWEEAQKSKINGLNTITREMVDEKLAQFE